MKALMTIVLTLTALISWSQSDSVRLDDVLVQSNRISQSDDESGRNVTVLSRKDLLNSGVRSIDDALQSLAGIEVQMRGPYGTQADISMRGGTFNQVMVLIDGQPVNDPLTGHFNGNIPVNLIDIKQIEILRGPSAAVYGPDAVGGVVNIVTQANHGDKRGLQLRGGYEFGDYGLQKWDLAGNVGFGNWRGGVSYTSVDADGQDHPMDSTSRYLDINTLSGFVSYENKDLSASFRISTDQRDFDARYYYTRSSFDRSTEVVDRLWLQGRVDYALSDDHVLSLNLSRIDTDDDFLFSPASIPNQHTTIRNDIRLEWKSQWSDQFSLVTGAATNLQSIESNDRGDHEEERFGVFALAEYKPINGLTLTPAIRLDYAQAYDWQANPQLAMSYQTGDWLIRGMTGRSIRAADFTERYVNFGRQDTLAVGRNLGNPDLVAETSWSHEVGVEYNYSETFNIAVTGFIRESENLIDYIVTPTEEIEDQRLLQPGGEYFFTQNVGELSHRGLETRLTGETTIADDWLVKGFVSHTFVETDGVEGEVSKYLSNHARHLVSWQIGLAQKWGDVSVGGVYKVRNAELAEAIGAELADEYHVMNARVSINVLGQFLKLYGQVSNLTDETYSDILGAQLPGRWWSAGVRLNWK